MAKKQTRRSISVSRTTYEKLKSFCETNGISMSQFVENRVGDFLGEPSPGTENADSNPRPAPAPVRPMTSAPRPVPSPVRPVAPARPVASTPAPPPARSASPTQPPMTSAAARYAVEPPPPIIKRAEQPAPKAPAMPKANEIFTF